jgi:hypothetical protein
MAKNWVETEGPQMTSQYGVSALHAGLARLHTLMYMHIYLRACMRTHTFTHRPISKTPVAFPWQQWFTNAPQCYVTHTLPLLFYSVWVACHLRTSLMSSIHPSIHGTTAPSGPLPASKVASILPYFPLFSSILTSLISVMRPSAQHPPIWFLVFL